VYAELSRCVHDVTALSEFDPLLADAVTLLDDARVRVTEACEQLRRTATHYDADPETLERVQQRLGVLHDLGRKHRVAPEQLADVQHSLSAELQRLESAASDRQRLDQDIDKACSEWDALAGPISAARHDAAERLARAVTGEMHDLGMPGGEFCVALSPVADDQRPAAGKETVELQVTTNPGHPLRPLARVASGGELSRISLAIQVIVAGLGPATCLIFDEVDVGVGGHTAEMVGRRLCTLSETRQILCVTHLPQVASRGAHHLRVRKLRDAGTHVTVDALDDAGRVNEIARMLGGARVTARSIAHAREMLGAAP
jgi:DNA repair protein RecN (Recombination protein N)